MKISPGKPRVGAPLVVARPRRLPIFIPLYGLFKAMVIPAQVARPDWIRDRTPELRAASIISTLPQMSIR